jgi:hypothetical protein
VILPGGYYQWFVIPTFNEGEGDANDGTGWIIRTEIQAERYDRSRCVLEGWTAT